MLTRVRFSGAGEGLEAVIVNEAVDDVQERGEVVGGDLGNGGQAVVEGVLGAVQGPAGDAVDEQVPGLARARPGTLAVVEASRLFGYRLPELFCGFARDEFAVPVPYPTSCSPQAWAAAAPLLLLHSLLRFTPEVSSGQLWCAPEIPEQYLPLRVSGLRVGKSRLAVEIGAGQWEITGLEPVASRSSRRRVRRARAEIGAGASFPVPKPVRRY